MKRRDLFGAMAGAAVLVTAADAVLAADEDDAGHEAHHGGSQVNTVLHSKLIETASDCVRNGEVCIAHCLRLFTAGDTSVADCAKSTYQMTALCEALSRLAAANSEHLPGLARLAGSMCLECEKACREHEHHHAECRVCAESCAACAEECKKLDA
jgi:Cys-rich four helix bundle protein (predicted Tat secretion target)